MYCKDLFKDQSPYHLEDYSWCIECPQDCTPPFEVLFKESHGFGFQKKLVNFGGSCIQASQKKSITKGKGEKITPLDIVEVLKFVTMVDYEVITSKQDFVELHDGSKRRWFNRRLDLSFESHHPSSSQLNLSLVPSGRTSRFHSPQSC